MAGPPKSVNGERPPISTEPEEVSSGVRTLNRLLWSYRGVTVVLGVIAAWRGRFMLTPDAVSYLDLGDAILSGGPAAAVNSYWSPLYPTVVAVVRTAFGFDPALEIPLAHLANLLVFLASMIAFETLLRELLVRVGWTGVEDGAPRTAALCLVGMGYPLFLVSVLGLIGLGHVTPDVAVAGFVLAATALTLAVSRRGTVRFGLGLGVVLGLGYLTKTVMMTVGIGILLCGWIVARDRRSRAAMAAATLVAVCINGVFVAALSSHAGHVTTGESGKLNYAFHVNAIEPFSHAPVDLGPYGTLENPLRMVSLDPPVYEFADPVGGTYPPWFDPGYWYRGVEPRFEVDQQLVTIKRNLGRWRDTVLPQLRWGLLALAVVAAAAVASMRDLSTARVLGAVWLFFVPLSVGVGPLVMYLIVHVQPRYLGGFVLLVLLGLLCVVLHLSRRPIWLAVVAVVAGAFVTAGVAFDVVTEPAIDRVQRNLRVASALHEAGLESGSEIGFIGNAYTAYWARLGRLRIIADIPRKHVGENWSVDDERNTIALDAFRRAGAQAVVTISDQRLPPPWQRLKGSRRYWVAFVASEDPGPSPKSS
jgi:hypothetical protein